MGLLKSLMVILLVLEGDVIPKHGVWVKFFGRTVKMCCHILLIQGTKGHKVEVCIQFCDFVTEQAGGIARIGRLWNVCSIMEVRSAE